MPRPKGSTKTPSLTHHKASGRAVVRIDGVDNYCGDWNTPEAKREYDRLIGEWLVRGRQTPPAATDAEGGILVKEIIAGFWQHACGFYGGLRPDGKAEGELDNFRLALRPLNRLYGETPAASFGPIALKAIRNDMIATTYRGVRWSRRYVNRQIARIKHVFKWATENELLPPSIYQALSAVAGVRAGRSEARETAPVLPVAESAVEAVLPLLSAHVAAMIRLQLFTGARPGEICLMRTGDIDRARPVWIYTPQRHKTQHHGHARQVRIGSRAQEVLTPFLKLDPTAYIFSPAEAEADRLAELRDQRRTHVQPSQVQRSQRAARRRRARAPRDRYDVDSYRRAIARACDEAFPPPDHLTRLRVAGEGHKRKALRWETRHEWQKRLGHEKWAELAAWENAHRWNPHQLRHSAATRWRREFGAEATLTLLGDRTTKMVDIYAEKAHATADDIIAKIG